MKIFVIDDSPVSRKAIHHELSQGGYETVECASGREALEKITDIQPDLITLDINMPDLDGFETCLQIREQNQAIGEVFPAQFDIPIIFVTANDTKESRIKGFECGASDFITKPFFQGQLLRKVDHLLNPEGVYTGLKVLLVDDSTVMMRIILRSLKSLGLEVVCAGNGREAFEMVRESPEAFHLVLTDYIMPEMNGDALCLHIRNDLGLIDLPVIIMSAMEDMESILDIFNAGATDFIPKPFVSELFLARVRSALNQYTIRKDLQQTLLEAKQASPSGESLLSLSPEDLRKPLEEILKCASALNSEACPAEEMERLVNKIKASGTYLMSLAQ